MEIFDISQELTGCAVYPGDDAPKTERVSSMDRGDLYNLTNLSLCAHNGTHVDAPLHFISDGAPVDRIPLEKFVGPCRVICHNGPFTAGDVAKLAETGEFPQRILIKGDVTVMPDGAKAFREKGIFLLGNESQTVGPEDAPMEVHKILLGAAVVLLEGVRLSHVEPGDYFLCAQPISIAGSDGAPCRAVLLRF